MTREQLLRNRDYMLSQLQLSLLNLIGNYKDGKKLKAYELANELGVSKGYVSQLLNATFDHKLSKVADLSLACNVMPILNFVDLDTFVRADANDQYFELIPVTRPRNMTYEAQTAPHYKYSVPTTPIERTPTVSGETLSIKEEDFHFKPC